MRVAVHEVCSRGATRVLGRCGNPLLPVVYMLCSVALVV